MFNIMKNQRVLLIITITILLTGCLGPKKINKWVDGRYGESNNFKSKSQSDYLSVTSPLITTDQKSSSTKKETKNMLPLLFYWQYDYVNTCTLNPNIPINTFKSAVQSYSNAKRLKQKVGGQKIELTINKIPNLFVINDRGPIIRVIYAVSWDNVTFQPDNTDMDVSYKIMKDNIETKKGSVTVSNTVKILGLKYLQSIKKITGQYLDQYDENIKLMSKQVVDQIIAAL